MLQALLWATTVVLAGLNLLSWLPFVHLRLSGIAPVVLLLFVVSMGGFSRAVLLALAVGRRQLTAELKAAPLWVRAGWLLTPAYSLIVGWLEVQAYRGHPVATASGYFLKDHGKLVGSLTELAYWHAARAEVRQIASVLLVFAFWGAAVCSCVSEPAQRDREDA